MVYVIVGPSGVGKTTIASRIGLPQIISTTSRKMRDGEVDGETYHFKTPEIFSQLDFIERVEYAGNHYGLQTDDVRNAQDSGLDHYVILDRKGAVILKRMFDDVKIIYLKATPEELVRFMRKRGDSWEHVVERLVNIITDKELDNDDIADLIIDNTNLAVIESKIKQFINYKKFCEDFDETYKQIFKEEPPNENS